MRDQRIALPASLLVAVVVALVDYLTTDAIALSFFYLLPVIAVTRAAGKVPGIALATVCAVASPLTTLLAGETVDPGMAFWNFAVRGATLLTVVLLVERLDAALAHEQELGRTDPVTQLSNPRSFREQAEPELLRAARYARPLTLAFMDLDDFKRVNDEMGHAKGDELLAKVGGVLDTSTRSLDIVGRLGGDEFALLMPETEADAARVVVERIRERLQELLQEDGLPNFVSFSFGMVTTDAPQDDLDALVLVADQLMYSAKRAGKNQVKAKDLTSGVATEASDRVTATS